MANSIVAILCGIWLRSDRDSIDRKSINGYRTKSINGYRRQGRTAASASLAPKHVETLLDDAISSGKFDELGEKDDDYSSL